MSEIFLLVAYAAGTFIGYYWGRNAGVHLAIESLVLNGYLKYRGSIDNPDIIKHDEE